MKKLAALCIALIGMVSLTSCMNANANVPDTEDKVTIEMKLDENYDDTDPFINERLFCVSEDLDTLTAEVTFEMDGESGILEVKNNKTNEVLWSNSWEENVKPETFTISLKDLKKDDEYVYTIKFANPTKISGGASEEGGKGGQIVENLSVGGNSIYSGINNANAILSKNLSLAHAKLVVVSEDVARDGLYDITDLLARNGEIRPDIYIAVAENSQEYILEIQPVIELNPAKYYQLTYEKNEFGGVARNSAVEYYFSNMTGNRDCVLPLAGTANTDGEERSENSVSESVSENKRYEDSEKYESDFENNGRNYLAGQAGLRIANKSETIGMAVFNADEYIGKLGSIETELYNILSGQIEENYIEFAKTVESAGADFVTLHARTRSQLYQGSADWKKIGLLKKELKIPVFANGDIKTIEDVKNCIKDSNADGVSVGRGIMGDFSLPYRIEQYFEKGVILPPPSFEEKISMLKEHLNSEIEFMGEKNGVKFMRKFYNYYISQERNCSKYRSVLVRLETRKEILKVLDEILSLHYSNSR